jgi:hypothetical protein
MPCHAVKKIKLARERKPIVINSKRHPMNDVNDREANDEKPAGLLFTLQHAIVVIAVCIVVKFSKEIWIVLTQDIFHNTL